MKLGWLQMRILMMIKNEKMHGYSIIRELKEYTGRTLSPGTLYPALKKLENRGLIKSHEERGFAAKRKVYSLTEKGERELAKIYKDFFGLKFITREIARFFKERCKRLKIEKGSKVLYFCLDTPKMYEIIKEAVGDEGEVLILQRHPVKEIPNGAKVIDLQSLSDLRDLDYIIALDGIEPIIPKIIEISKLIEISVKILRKGGILTLDTINYDNFLLRALFNIINIPIVNEYSKDEILKLLNKNFSKVTLIEEKGLITYVCKL